MVSDIEFAPLKDPVRLHEKAPRRATRPLRRRRAARGVRARRDARRVSLQTGAQIKDWCSGSSAASQRGSWRRLPRSGRRRGEAEPRLRPARQPPPTVTEIKLMHLVNRFDELDPTHFRHALCALKLTHKGVSSTARSRCTTPRSCASARPTSRRRALQLLPQAARGHRARGRARRAARGEARLPRRRDRHPRAALAARAHLHLGRRGPDQAALQPHRALRARHRVGHHQAAAARRHRRSGRARPRVAAPLQPRPLGDDAASRRHRRRRRSASTGRRARPR